MKEGVHTIIQKIQEDAETHGHEQYQSMKEEIDAAIDKDNSFYQEELSKRKEMFVKHKAVELSRLQEQMNSRLNREYLSYQHLLIDDIFAQTVERLRKISVAEFSALFLQSVRGLQGEFCLHIGALSQAQFDRQIIAQAEGENPGLVLTIAPAAIPLRSGFLLMDERVEYNCLFEDLIEDKKNQQATAILKEVFES